MSNSIQDDKTIDEYYASASNASAEYTNKDAAIRFFDLHELQADREPDLEAQYLQLKYLHEDYPWRYLSMLGKLFLAENKPFSAFICLLESLRIKPDQKDIFQLALSLVDKCHPIMPTKLRDIKFLVSVIVPTIGRCNELKECIKSILDQTLQDFEIIIVNDGGWEGVKEVLDSFNSDKIRYINIPKQTGIGKAVNQAILQAEGKYVAYLDDDDVYYPEHLETIVHHLEKSNYRIGYANVHEIEGTVVNGIFQRKKILGVWDVEFDRNLLLQQIYLTPGSTVHERSIVQDVGLYREDLHMSVDWEYWLRCSQKFEFIHISRLTSEWRKKHDNYTRRDALSAHFYPKLHCIYHGLFQGKVVLAKCYLTYGQKDKAEELFREIRKAYFSAAKADFMFRDLIYVAHKLSDGKFVQILARDYFYYSPKDCTKLMQELRSGYIFLGIGHKLPWKILQVLFRRIANFLAR